MLVVFTLVLLAVLTGVFIWRPVWGAYALVFTLPFERIGSWALHPSTGHPVVRLSQVVGGALIAATLVALVRRRVKFAWPRGPLWLLAGFVAWCGLALAHSYHSQLVNGFVALGFVAALVYALYLLWPYVQLPQLQATLMASAGLVAVFGLYQFVAGAAGVSPAYTGLRAAYTSQVFGYPRVQSTALEPLYFADYLLIPLLVGLALLVFSPKDLPLWQRVCLAAAGLSFVLTMSRGAFIGAVGGVVLAGVAAWIWHKKLAVSLQNVKRLAVTGAALLGLGLALVAGASAVSSHSLLKGPEQFLEQITTKLTQTSSFTDRSSMRGRAVAIIKAQPVFGVGIEGITPYLRNYPAVRSQDDVIALNNQLLELIAEAGIIGAVLFYGFLVWLLGEGLRSLAVERTHEQAWVLGLVAAVVAITIQAQSFSGFLLTHIWVSYGLLAGLALQGHNKLRISSKGGAK